MKRFLRIVTVAVIVAGGERNVLASQRGAAAPEAPKVELADGTVSVTEVPAGGSIVLFSIAREPVGSISQIRSRHELLVDEDGDGAVQYAPSAGLANRSIWMIVNFADGSVVVRTPRGAPVLMHPYGAGEGIPVQFVNDHLDVRRAQVSVLLVRPGFGAWAAVVRDGGEADWDGSADGRLRLDPSKLRPLAAAFGAAPGVLHANDVLAVLDASRLEYWHGRPGGGVE